MHPAEIIELFDAGLYGTSRQKNHMVNLWKVTGIPGYPHKTPCRTYLEGSASICIFSDLKVMQDEGPGVLSLSLILFPPHFNDPLHNEP